MYQNGKNSISIFWKADILDYIPLYFHGTDLVSAIGIIEDGIDIDLCSHNPTDFGLNCFYVSDNFSLSLDWARIRYVKYVAVLCYSVSNLQLSERESKIFETADLESVEQMVWGWIKSCHRNNCF